MKRWDRYIQVFPDCVCIVEGVTKVGHFVMNIVDPILRSGLSPDVAKAAEESAFYFILDLLMDIIFLSFCRRS